MTKYKTHECYEKTDEQLKEHNTKLLRNIFDPNQLVVATERISNLRDGKRAKVVIATYCPFCGKRVIKP